ncbi:MAG: DEAD/DEAH box helicase [Myxococcales bacterium]|nr:DEAD/DEAH box helicase [Myxococcales bacterium]
MIAARKRGVKRMLLALPTGAGKTIVFSELIRQARHDVLVLAHRDELLAQAKEKIEAALARSGDTRRVEIERGEKRASKGASVLVASIRSLHEGRIGKVLVGRDIRLIIYDECHHAVADANRNVLESIGCFDPDWPGTLVGVTATTRRADGKGLGEIFEEIVAERTLQQMIEDGYLRPLRGLRIETKSSLENVATRGNDFELESLEEAVDVEGRNQLVARSITELCRDRRTIAFCVGVRHAENLSRALNELGVRAGMVCGEMPKVDRRRTLKKFREGKLQVITNVGVLTEGFDDPGVSAIVMVRPTRSEALYLQCVGRGMRLDPSAQDCLVLDFVDLSSLDIITSATLEAGTSREPPEREEQAEGAGAIPLLEDDMDEAPATLEQITQRLIAFDPLTMAQRDEAAAISVNAWLSLGTRGMMLHFLGRRGEMLRFELKPAPRSGVEVWLEERKLARCPTMQEAIEAVDLELPNYGVEESARSDALWRQHPITPPLQRAISALRPPRIAHTVGDAIAHLALRMGFD